MSETLFGQVRERRPRWKGSTALVLRQSSCLSCGDPVEETAFDQMPLFRSHGFGAIRRSVFHVCGSCHRVRLVTVTDANPL